MTMTTPHSEPVQLSFIFETPVLPVFKQHRGSSAICGLCFNGVWARVDSLNPQCSGCRTVFNRYGKALSWPAHTGVLWAASKARSSFSRSRA